MTKKNLITEVVDNMDGRGASVRKIDEMDLGAPREIVPSSDEQHLDKSQNTEKQEDQKQ